MFTLLADSELADLVLKLTKTLYGANRVFILPIHNLAEAKGPVMDSLEKSGLFDIMGEGKVFMSTHDAIRDLGHGCPPKT